MLYFDAPTDSTARLAPRELVGACFEDGTRQLLLDHGALPGDFFDLSSGVAGDLAQKLANYGIRAAVVLPNPNVHSESFQAFARETAYSGQLRFFQSRDDAVEWLSSGS